MLTMGSNGNGLGDGLLLLPAAMVGEKSRLHSLTVRPLSISVIA